MAAEEQSTSFGGEMPARPERTGRRVAVVAAVVLAVTMVGGYGLNWSWTGFKDNDTVWDWLNLVLLPIALALLPLWLSTRDRWQARWRLGATVLALVLLVLLIGGYGFGWSWTGFADNTLWDWLKLLLVPFVLPAAVAWATAGKG
jgi:nitrate reductase NapE component